MIDGLYTYTWPLVTYYLLLGGILLSSYYMFLFFPSLTQLSHSLHSLISQFSSELHLEWALFFFYQILGTAQPIPGMTGLLAYSVQLDNPQSRGTKRNRP